MRLSRQTTLVQHRTLLPSHERWYLRCSRAEQLSLPPPNLQLYATPTVLK
jgi:hypothetical protein